MKTANLLACLVMLLLVSSALATTQPLVPSTSAQSSADVAENTWVSKAPMNVARSVLGVAVVNGKIYAIGGSTESGFAPSIPGSAVYGNINIGGFVGTNEEYDPATDTWTYKSPMPTPRIAFAIAAYQNKIYCIGGRSIVGSMSGGYTGVNEVYDPATDTWETKASMPTARGWLQANVVGGKIYVMDYSGTNYVYDPATDSWTTKAPVPVAAFNGYASAVLGKKIYVIGGLSKNYDGNLNLIYDTETDTWSYGAPPPSSHGGGAAGATTGEMAPKRIYVLGEIANLRQGEEQTFVRVYDPATDSWTFGAAAPTSRYNFGVAVVNDTLYAIGGHTHHWIPGDFAPTNLNEQYIPIGYGTIPPTVHVISPENNRTYSVSNVSLTFTVNKPALWMGYSLDAQDNVTITGNTTIAGLTSGLHNITVYAKDSFGNTGASETVTFTIAEEPAPEPFPTAAVVATSGAAVVVIASIGLLYYRKNRKQKLSA